MTSLDSLGLSSYPFSVVAPHGPTSEWADRGKVKKRLQSLVRSWQLKPSSAIYLMWADFGAGKTHALRYLEWLGESAKNRAVCVYCDIPLATADFRGVYVQIAPRLEEADLNDAILAFRETYGEAWLRQPQLQGDRDTPIVLWSIATMGQTMTGDLARKWLRGERLASREMSTLGVSSWLKNSEFAIRALCSVCHILLASPAVSRVVLMFDEFQRIGQVSHKRLMDVNAGLSTVFNRCPEGLSIVLSYSFGDPANISYLVSSEVRSRVTDQPIHLQAFSVDEALQFMDDLLSIHAERGADVRLFKPKALTPWLERLFEDLGHEVTPRKLMQAADLAVTSALDNDETFPLTRTSLMKHYAVPMGEESE